MEEMQQGSERLAPHGPQQVVSLQQYGDQQSAWWLWNSQRRKNSRPFEFPEYFIGDSPDYLRFEFSPVCLALLKLVCC